MLEVSREEMFNVRNCFLTKHLDLKIPAASTSHLTIDLLLLTVSDRKCVEFSMIVLRKNRFGFRSELAESKKSNDLDAAHLRRSMLG